MTLLEYHDWTPNGRRRRDCKPDQYRERVIAKAKAMVRETGYHLVRLLAEDGPKDKAFSRSVDLYTQACELLFALDSDAEQFCRETYDPGSQYRFLA